MQNHVCRNDMISIAKLYYNGGKSQDEIAKLMNLSRPKVSRMLTLAKQRRIVEFRIDSSGQQRMQMAEDIRERYGLSAVLVSPAYPTREQSMESLSDTAGAFLNEHLRDGLKIGISFSTVVDHMVRRFAPARKISDASVYQLLGGTLVDSSFTDVRDSVRIMADKLSARPHYMQAPLVVGSTMLCDLLHKEAEIREHFDAFENLDIAVIGLGSSDPESCLLYKTGYITLEESNDLQAQGYKADICAHRLDDNGEEGDTFLRGRVMAIDLPVLRRIPIVMGVGLGEHRTDSILSAIRGKYINVLAIDEITAITLLAKDNE